MLHEHEVTLRCAVLALGGVGRKTAREALANCAGIETAEAFEIWAHDREWPKRCDVQSEHLPSIWSEAASMVRKAIDDGITLHTEDTPTLQDHPIWQIPDAPLVLFTRGTYEPGPSVAIIGTRTPTEWTLEKSSGIIEVAANHVVSIVSGLALGCDTLAHCFALEQEQHTTAILGTGLNHAYPKKNASLQNGILESGGMLMSEYPPETTLNSHQLVERDRLQSGLSDRLLLLESSVSGGSMHTVKAAAKQGRPIGAILPSEDGLEEAFGGNMVAVQEHGAVPIRSVKDLNAFMAKPTEQSSNGTLWD